MGNVVPVCVWIITIPILAYGIYAVNRNDVPVWESLVPMLCQTDKSGIRDWRFIEISWNICYNRITVMMYN
mgnify:FL=1